MDIKHYNQTPKRDATFIMPPNILKAKVGSGGLSAQVLKHAQKLLETHTEDFTPLADIYLSHMIKGIENAENIDEKDHTEELINTILLPCVQLKANGAMFHYQLITRIADRFVQFMEVVERLDSETLEIARAFHTTIKIVVAGKISGNGGSQGDRLVEELNNACMRYFEKHKDTLDAKKNS
ncbi:MAG: hypothetical protein COA45_11610 [Zetaproteobacteria bacterium]|nr:MAG: hypothetical protein COA45_11610 [Zetaproteobacteria bacterium]